jgi:hypothetical protein
VIRRSRWSCRLESGSTGFAFRRSTLAFKLV